MKTESSYEYRSTDNADLEDGRVEKTLGLLAEYRHWFPRPRDWPAPPPASLVAEQD